MIAVNRMLCYATHKLAILSDCLNITTWLKKPFDLSDAIYER